VARAKDRPFWSMVLRTDGCWIWQGARNERGYGVYRRSDGRRVYAHRYAFEDWLCALQEGECVLHACDNPTCVRPLHLFPGDRADNNADMAGKDRGRKASLVALGCMVLYVIGDMPYQQLAQVAGISKMSAKRARRIAGMPRGNRWHPIPHRPLGTAEV